MGPPPERIAEWGVGHGLLILEALERWPQAQAAILDLSKFSLAFTARMLAAAGMGNRCESYQGDVVKLPATRSVQRLICSELLEHVPNPKLLLERLRDALAPGGLAYLTGAINAAQPDHVSLFTSTEQLLSLVEEQGLVMRAHLTACHPNRQAEQNPPAVVAMVVQRDP